MFSISIYNFRIIFLKPLLIVLLGFYAQNLCAQKGKWSLSNTPRYRNANSVWMFNHSKMIAVGGWLTNDSLTGIYTSKDSGITWDLNSDNFGGQLNDVFFTSDLNGFAIGKYGRFVKTTDGGTNWNFSDLSAFYATDLKSIKFASNDTCWIAGGGSNSNRTIVLTSNNTGNTWTASLDSNNGKLNSIYTINNTIWACGENGLVYTTNNGGSNWKRIYLNSTETFQSVFFTDAQTGFIVGGNELNNSQLIFKTTNGGINWAKVRDTLAPKLNSIYFYNTNEGYAVGNLGTILFTSNAGNQWKTVAIDSTVNDNRDLNDVFFINKYRGIAVGSAGKILNYKDYSLTAPKINLSKIYITKNNKLRFEGNLNAEGLPSKCYLKYGTDLGMSQTYFVGDFSGNNIQTLNTILNLPKGFYYAKFTITSIGGTSESNTLTAFSGKSEVPNFDFENWDSTTTENLLGWEPNGIVKKHKFSGNKLGLYIQSKPNTDGPGALIYGTPTDKGLGGGIPFKGKPTSIVLHCAYKNGLNDSCAMFVNFKNKGKSLFRNIFTWHSANYKDTTLEFPISYNDTLNTDTLTIGLLSTNYFGNNNDTASHLYLDSIWFKGTNATIPNMGFNKWLSNTDYMPYSWYDQSYVYENKHGIFKSTHAQSSQFSAHLSTLNSKIYPSMSTRSFSKSFKMLPSFPVSAKYNFLHGYTHFLPKAIGDTLAIQLMLFKNGVQQGGAQFYKTNTDTGFIPFTLPINYYNNITPDSASINVYIYNSTRRNNPSNAEAWVDQLSFENWIDNTTQNLFLLKKFNWLLYPNPSSSIITIQLNNEFTNPVGMIFSTDGKLLIQKQLNSAESKIDISNLANGIYYFTIKNDNFYQTKTFIKNN